MGSALNAICPYYTMFPLDFPMRVIKAQRRGLNGWIVDPFCGRGTTNLAARLAGMPTAGVDSSPIAVAVAQAKLCSTEVERIVRAAKQILDQKNKVRHRPRGEFWNHAYAPATLTAICRLREALLANCTSDTRRVLRAILLGALHGPRTKFRPSHLSNQCPRTYAPKPNYAVKYWSLRDMTPPKIDVLDVIRVRAKRFLRDQTSTVDGHVRLGDSRKPSSFEDVSIGLVITSPPYYGMRTYVSDQWLRAWFLGGPDNVDYKPPAREIEHSSPDAFSLELHSVWSGLAKHAQNSAKLVIRFGGINDRGVDHVELLKSSLKESGWILQTVVKAGDAEIGKRQANQFLRSKTTPREEHDFYAIRE